MAEHKHDAAFFFDALVAKLGESKVADVQDRIVAHVRLRTGHSTLPSFQNDNTKPEDEKILVYKECIKAILTKDFSHLQGAVRTKPVSHDDLASDIAPMPVPKTQLAGNVTDDVRLLCEMLVKQQVNALKGEMVNYLDMLVEKRSTAIAAAIVDKTH